MLICSFNRGAADDAKDVLGLSDNAEEGVQESVQDVQPPLQEAAKDKTIHEELKDLETSYENESSSAEFANAVNSTPINPGSRKTFDFFGGGKR